jgi:hypothetical protein
MKKVLLTLLGIIVVVGVLAGAGFAGYRFGYMRGATATADGTAFVPWKMPMHNFDKNFNPQGMPMHNFGRGNDRDFNRGFGPGGHGGFFSLLRLVILGVIIWLAYKLVKNSGWKLALTHQAAESPKVEPAATEKTE